MGFLDKFKFPTQEFKTVGSWAFNKLKPPVDDFKTVARALPQVKSPFEVAHKMSTSIFDKLRTGTKDLASELYTGTKAGIGILAEEYIEKRPEGSVIERGYKATGKDWEKMNTVEKTKAFSQQFAYQLPRTAAGLTVGQLGSVSGALGYAERFGFKKAKPIADKFDEWAGKIASENPTPARADAFVSGLGSMSTFILPGLGVAKGTQMLTKISPKIANLFGNSAMTVLESSMEAGGVYRDLKAQGYSDEEAKRNADIDFGINTVLLALTNRYKFVGNEGMTLVKEIKNRLFAGGRELVQEMGQQVAGNIATYKEWDEGVREAAEVGGLLGFLFGGSINPNINMNVQTQKEIIDLIQKTTQKIPAGLTIEDVSKPSDRLLETMRQPTLPKADPLITEARKYKSAEEFVEAQPKVYHGTRVKFDDFDIGKSSKLRTKEFGGIDSVYFSESLDVAKKYSKSPQAEFFDISIIEKIKQKNKFLGDAVEKMYKYGDDADLGIKSSDDFLKRSDGYSLTQSNDIAAAIKGSKIDLGFEGVQGFGGIDKNLNAAYMAKQTLSKLGLGEEIKQRIVTRLISSSAKIKELGYVDNNKLTSLAKKAKANNYDGIRYQTEQSIDNAPEIAIWNKDILKTKSQLTDIWNKAQVGIPGVKGLKKVGLAPKTGVSPSAKVAQAKQAPSGFITKSEKTLLKERIINIARGYREGRTMTKNEITDAQTEIVDILDKSKLERSDKAKFIRSIKNVQTTEQLKKALPIIQERVETLAEKAESRTIISKIQKAIKATVAKGKKPKGKYTPEIQNVLNSIKKLTDLNQKQASEKIENNLKEYAVKMPVEIAVENHILFLYTGTSTQKQELLNIINQLKEKGEVSSSLKKFNIQADIERKSELVVERVTGGKGLEEGRLHGEPTDKTKVQKVKQYLKAVGKKTILDWRGLMTTLDFNSSVKVKPLADFFSVSKNESKYKELQSKYVDEFNGAISSIYGVKNKPNSILKVVNKMTTEKVKVGELEYTRDELIKRHMEIQDPTLIESLERGNKFTEKTFKDIENKITEQDKKFAQWQLEYYQKMYSKVNEIYSKMNGVDLPFNEFYSPIRRVGYQVEPGHNEFMDEAFYRKAVTNKSLTSRVKNVKPILKQGSLSVLDKHITDTNYYISWAEKIRELDSVFTNNEVRESINQEFPNSILDSINTKIQHISTHGNRTVSRIGWVDAIRKSYVVGNLAVKPALTIKQLVSTLAYGEKISAKDLTVGIADFAKNPVENYKTLQNESWFIKMRGAGMERDIRDSIKEGVFDRYNKRQNLANSLLLNIRLGDKGAIILGSWAMRISRLKAGIPLQDVVNEYEEFGADTQQSADISRLSEIQLGGSLEKLFTIFKSSQRAYLQKETNAIKSMFRKDGFGKDNVKRVAKVMFIYHILLPVTFQWIANMGGWDEDDKKDYLRAGILGSLNGLFVAGDVIDGILRGVMGMRVWDIDTPIADIGDDINKIISNLTEDDIDIEDMQTALDAFASATTSLSGLPVEYGYDILESLYNENYDTAIKQLLGWSEYVIGEEKKPTIFPSSSLPSRKLPQRKLPTRSLPQRKLPTR